jgi:hypothetical protein
MNWLLAAKESMLLLAFEIYATQFRLNALF